MKVVYLIVSVFLFCLVYAKGEFNVSKTAMIKKLFCHSYCIL